jgi:hypothetical protein
VHGEPGYSVQPAPQPTPDEVWLVKFQSVLTKDDAKLWWDLAKDAGVSPEDLARYVAVATERLEELENAAATTLAAGWDAEFARVQNTDDAGAAWKAAKAAGVEPMELQRLVQLAQQRLSELGVTG